MRTWWLDETVWGHRRTITCGAVRSGVAGSGVLDRLPERGRHHTREGLPVARGKRVNLLDGESRPRSGSLWRNAHR